MIIDRMVPLHKRKWKMEMEDGYFVLSDLSYTVFVAPPTSSLQEHSFVVCLVKTTDGILDQSQIVWSTTDEFQIQNWRPSRCTVYSVCICEG